MTDQHVRVELRLDPDTLDDLDLIVAYRHGAKSRSELVRDAISWLLTREAAWLIRARSARAKRDAQQAALEAARATPRDRERVAADETIAEALRIAREND